MEVTSNLPLSQDVLQYANRYHEIREKKRELEAQVADLDAERDQLAELIKKTMDELNLQKFNLKNIGTFYLATSVFPKVVGDPDKVIAWLDEQGAGNIAPRTISKPAFKEMYQDRLDKDLPVPPADLVEMTTDIGLRLRGEKAKKD